MIIVSTDTTCSPTFNDTSEVLSKGSDLKIHSRATWVLSPIVDDDTTEEVSWSSDEAAEITAAATASDLTIVSTDTTCSPPFNDTNNYSLVISHSPQLIESQHVLTLQP
ncbi:unnamed protein product [Pleuronectes platessa]|uniref:Uncharacterized protein n=1 Tax=Pleuronectes platessa TaxID=8262 RepID=A0A9N7W0S0_PLEPL|nr:unnamed protein product [Pleuronectes platessa]